MVSDRVGDFIIRLQNAAMVGKKEVVAPYSSHLEAIAKKLKQLGFVASVSVDGEPKKVLKVELALNERGRPVLQGVKRISKPGRRLYVSHKEAHSVKGGTGARIISTPGGVATDKEARSKRVGGENLFEVW